MNNKTIKKLHGFNMSQDEAIKLNSKYEHYEKFLNKTIAGEGVLNEVNYLLLWDKNEIQDLNNAYEVEEFLSGIILIGSDGGDVAYGINVKGEFIEVPFIGMDDEEVKIVASDFDQFINYVYNK